MSTAESDRFVLKQHSTPSLVVPLPVRPILRPSTNSFNSLMLSPSILWPNGPFWPNSTLPLLPLWPSQLPNLNLKSPNFVPKTKMENVKGEAAREYKCTHCKKCYDSPTSFHMHMRTHMNGCECPICGKTFSRHWLLQGHIRTHTGEKPFKCPVCSKAFADKSNLRAHIQTHSGIKPFACKRCGKAFALKSYLSKHEESACFKSSLSLVPLQASLRN